MNKLMIFIMLAALAANMSIAGEISQVYEFREPAITLFNNFDQVELQGCWTISNPGEPALPRKAVTLLLPPGEEAISIRIEAGERIKLDDVYKIQPAQRQYPLSYSGPVEMTPPLSRIYESNAAYPTAFEGNLNTYFKRGHGLVSTNICPFQYFPLTGELYYYPRMQVIVTTKNSARAMEARDHFLRTDRLTNAGLRKLIDNPEAVNYLYGQSSTDVDGDGNYEYLIITNQTMYDSVKVLADYKNKCGILTEVMLIGDILGEYAGRDSQEKIRNCIIDQFRSHDIDYVLLAGDDEILAHRGLFDDAGGYENDPDIAADIYYCNLDGNWNNDGDSYWGEPGEDDLYSEVAIGRLAIDSPTEAAHFINKIIMYQNQPCLANTEQALMAGEDLGWDVSGKDYKEEIRLGSSNHGYTTAGIPPNFEVQTLYDDDGVWSPLGDLMPILNSGMNLVNHLGHADVGYMMKLYNSNINDNNCTNDGIENGFYIVYSQGCYCGSFDNRDTEGMHGQDCISEVWTTIGHGAVAIVSNSRYGWGDVSNTNGSSQYYDRQFFDAIFGEDITLLGATQVDAKEDNVPYINFAQNRWCCYCSNLFGEPTMDLWTGAASEIYASHDDVFFIGTNEFQVSLADAQAEPIAGALVGLSVDDAAIGRGYTDVNGSVTIEIFNEVTEPGQLVIKATGHNLIPYQQTIEIIPPAGPYISFEEYAIDDEVGGNGNSLLDYGETIELWLSLQNVGIETANNVYAEISGGDSYVDIVDNTAHFGNLAAGEIRQAQDSYTISISPLCPDNHPIQLTITSHADNHPEGWECRITLLNHAPTIAFSRFIVDDSQGNGNGRAEPGETVGLQVSLANLGSCDLNQFSGTMFVNNQFININPATIFGGDLPINQTLPMANPFSISIDPDIDAPRMIDFTLSIHNDNGYFASMNIRILVGGYFEDFESGENDWQHYIVTTGFLDQWHLSETRNHTESGSLSWKCGNSGSAEYANRLDAGLQSPAITITGNCILSYWQWIQAEISTSYPGYAYDGGLVEISTDQGSTWEQIAPIDSYPYLIRDSSSPGPFPSQTPCFANNTTWDEIQFDLSAFADLSVMFRFRFGSDGVIGREGWYVDDVQITKPNDRGQPSSLAVSLTENTEALLSWNAPLDCSPIGYNVYRSGQMGVYGEEPINDNPLTDLTFIDSGCNMTRNNYYVVTALYENDIESNYSNEALLPIVFTSVEDNQNNIPSTYELFQNYPNPFNPTTTINYDLPRQSRVNITVYDILGRKVATLIDTDMPAGSHQIIWQADRLASGMYLYRLNAGDYTQTRKMLMLK